MSISIYFEQIPEDEGIDTQDYPECTSFIWDHTPLKRDPVTFQLIRPKRRAKIYPDDIAKVQAGDKIPMHRFVSLLRNGNNLLCPLCRNGRMKSAFDPKLNQYYCDGCGWELIAD